MTLYQKKIYYLRKYDNFEKEAPDTIRRKEAYNNYLKYLKIFKEKKKNK